MIQKNGHRKKPNGAINGKKRDQAKRNNTHRRNDPLLRGRGGVVVTDHAFVRFVMRFVGEGSYLSFLENILPDETLNMICDNDFADGQYPIHNMDAVIVLKDKTVVTVQ